MSSEENNNLVNDTSTITAKETSHRSESQPENKGKQATESCSEYHPLLVSDPQENEDIDDDLLKEHDIKEGEWSDASTNTEKDADTEGDSVHDAQSEKATHHKKEQEEEVKSTSSVSQQSTTALDNAKAEDSETKETSQEKRKKEAKDDREDAHRKRRYDDKKAYEPRKREYEHGRTRDRGFFHEREDKRRDYSRSHEQYSKKMPYDRKFDSHKDATFHKDVRRNEREYRGQDIHEDSASSKDQRTNSQFRARTPATWGHVREPELVSLYVKFSFGTTEEEFTQVFQRFGTTTNFHFDEAKGFGFVNYNSEEGANRALAASTAHEILLHGEEPVIRIETERQNADRASSRPRAGLAGAKLQPFRSWDKRQENDSRERRLTDDSTTRAEWQRDWSRDRMERRYEKRDFVPRGNFAERRSFENRNSRDFADNRGRAQRTYDEHERDKEFSKRRYETKERGHDSRTRYLERDKPNRRERSPVRSSRH